MADFDLAIIGGGINGAALVGSQHGYDRFDRLFQHGAPWTRSDGHDRTSATSRQHLLRWYAEIAGGARAYSPWTPRKRGI